MRFPIKGFYLILQPEFIKDDIFTLTKKFLDIGIKIIQYRNKTATTKKFYLDALKLRKICKDATFIINDRVDIALAVGADGVHIGEKDLPLDVVRKILGEKRIIGFSTHSLKEAIKAQNIGADYISIGPIFKTTTKADAHKPVGLEILEKIRKRIKIPIVAIGGINLENAKKIISYKVDAICSISEVFKSDPVNTAKKFQELFLYEP